MSISITFIDALRMFEIADKLYNNQIALNDGEMISLRNMYKQLNDSEKEFILNKYGDSVAFLENYEGLRKRKYE